MKAFVTFDELKLFGQEAITENLVRKAEIKEGKTIFLSHASTDNALLPGVINILEKHGGRVYVDKRDTSLSQNDFTAVASRLRSAVRGCRKFVLFVTPNSKDSQWIPWELGLGDGDLGESNVALFPSAENQYEQHWSQQEYLGFINGSSGETSPPILPTNG